MPEQIAGIAIVPLIVGLVEVGKRLGLDARWAAPLAVALGLAISLANYAVDGCQSTVGAVLQPAAFDLQLHFPPSASNIEPLPCQSLVDAALIGLALGLSAAGLYSGAKKVLAA